MTSSHKVVLLGEGRVGKTSLVLRFCRDTFTEGQPPTIQASCLERALRLGDKTVNLVIWDTAGQERFHALGPIYYAANAIAESVRFIAAIAADEGALTNPLQPRYICLLPSA